jgi:hypothetical protein
VRAPLRRVHEEILKLLDSITISDLSAEDQQAGAEGGLRTGGIALTMLAH